MVYGISKGLKGTVRMAESGGFSVRDEKVVELHILFSQSTLSMNSFNNYSYTKDN